jgi:hypothetical protein
MNGLVFGVNQLVLLFVLLNFSFKLDEFFCKLGKSNVALLSLAKLFE